MEILLKLLGKKAPVDYAGIVAPLKQIETDLSAYIGDQKNNISTLEETKKGINEQITASDVEIKKSEFTVIKISELLSTDPETEPVEEPEDDKGTS
jgi:hypothetical protein